MHSKSNVSDFQNIRNILSTDSITGVHNNVYRDHYATNEATLKELFGNDFCIEDITPRHVISAMVVYLRIHF